jgi:hypothetical protein
MKDWRKSFCQSFRRIEVLSGTPRRRRWSAEEEGGDRRRELGTGGGGAADG